MMQVCPHSTFPEHGFRTLADCEEVCVLYPVVKQDDAFWGDSFECRFNHLGLIVIQQLAAVGHCPHAGASGGSTCVGETQLDQ